MRNLLALAILLITTPAFATGWQYTDATHTIAMQTNANGSVSSALVTSPDVQAWVNDGHTIAAEPAPSAAAQCAQAFAAGAILTNTSGSTPEAVGTFAIGPDTQSKIDSTKSLAGAYTENAGLSTTTFPPFPGVPSGEMPWRDAAGNVHLFTSYAHWRAWGVALGIYTTALMLACDAAAAGAPLSLPTNSSDVTP